MTFKAMIFSLILVTICSADWINGEVKEVSAVHDTKITVTLKYKTKWYNGSYKDIHFILNKGDFDDLTYAMHYATMLKAVENGTTLTLGYENEQYDYYNKPAHDIKTTVIVNQ